MNQVLTQNMLNYLTFWVSTAVAGAEKFVFKFFFWGGGVKIIERETFNHCGCKLQVEFWLGCNDVKQADTVQLIADDEVSASYPITINNS